MNNLNTAIKHYQEKVETSLELAHHIIAERESNRMKLIELNEGVSSIAMIARQLPKDDEQYALLQSALLSLEISIANLSAMANDAMQTLAGHLGRRLDELRESAEHLNSFPNQELEVFRPLLNRCQIAVDDACTKLINDCTTDSSILRVIRKIKK